uniref:Uncharacterized protein n=1 Tax=Amphiprion ocellaris TaxID=80972 RepID=A0A3Q1CLM1_AMPOC
MKLAAVFVVLSLIILMAEPGEGFIHHIFSGLVNGIANGIYHSLNVVQVLLFLHINTDCRFVEYSWVSYISTFWYQ